MINQPDEIRRQQIFELAKYLQKASIPQLACVKEFHTQILVDLLSEKRVKGYFYSECLSQLFVVLLKRAQVEPEVLDIYPDISTAIITISQIIDSKCYQQILQQLNNENASKLSSGHQYIVLQKYLESKKFSEPIQKNWLHKDQKSKKIVNSSQMLNEALGPQWVDIINHYQSENSQKRQKIIVGALKNRQARTLDCVGCIEYLEQSQILCYQDHRNDIIVFPSVKALRQFQLQLKQSICALVNSYGGYILFACTEDKLQLRVQGQTLNEVNKQSILQQLNQIFQGFVPKLNFAINAQLSFVPVAKQSQKCQKEESLYPQPHQYLEGMFVTRLKIWNHKKERLFFYQQFGQLNAFRRSQEGNKTSNQKLKYHSQVRRYLKKRFKTYYRKSIQDLDQLLTHKFIGVNQHKCKQPNVGKKCAISSREIPNYSLFELQNRYKYTSIIILKHISVSKVKSYLISQKITGFQFMPDGTETSKEVKILFHETSPKKLQQILAKYSNPTSKTILLIVDNAIKTQFCLKEQQFKQLKEYLKSMSFNSWLKFYKFQNDNQQDWFLNCEFKVDIYLIFTKLRAIGINGTRLARIDTSNKKFQLIYSS